MHSLKSWQLGFDSVQFARIDYQDRVKRSADKSLEVVWRGSKTFGSSSQVFKISFSPCLWKLAFQFWHAHFKVQIFAGAFPIHYSPPEGFHFEVNDDAAPVQVLNMKSYIILCFCCAFTFSLKITGWSSSLWLQCWTTCEWFYWCCCNSSKLQCPTFMQITVPKLLAFHYFEL